MHIHISPHDGVPIYKQIIQQVKYLVASGRLKPKDEMPPIRQLAQHLLINPNTVARAYRDLEQAGVVISRRGSGTVVSDNGSPLGSEEKSRILEERAEALMIEARQFRVDLDDVLDIVRKQHDKLSHEDDREEQGQ